MDADEYLKQVLPAGRQSRLAPFHADLLKLRDAGCTLEQLQDFLARNQVTMSIKGIAAYLQRHAQPGKRASSPPKVESAGDTPPIDPERVQSPVASPSPVPLPGRIDERGLYAMEQEYRRKQRRGNS